MDASRMVRSAAAAWGVGPKGRGAGISLTAALILLIAAAPARAALPDHWAFAYLDNANPPTAPASWVMDPSRQAGTFRTACPGSTATASSIGTGGYRVTFPCIGSVGGIAHVTTVDALGGFCEVDAWGQVGADEVVTVNCFDAVGAPANTRFTVLFTTSSGAAPGRTYAHVYANATGGVVTSYSSVAGAVTVTRVNRGVYLVTLAGMATGDLAGSLQITAVAGAPRRCKADSFALRGGDYDAWVACYETLGRFVDTAFTLSYHHKTTVVGTEVPPAQVAYILAPGAAPPNTNSSSALGAGANVVTPVGLGAWEVTYQAVAGPVTHMQVTAFGETPAYCQLSDVWSTVRSDVVAPVACFRPGGVAEPDVFFAAYATAD